MSEFIINDDNYLEFINPVIDGEERSHGCVRRDYSTHPNGCFAFAEPFPDSLLVPEDEIDGRIKYLEEQKSRLLDVREANYGVLKSLDQNGEPLCWAFSSTKCMMYLRTIMNEPPLVLSAWWVAGRVKNWRSEGGWGGESLKWIVQNGVPAMDFCPSYRSSYDTADTRTNAALHKCIEWWEGSDDPEKAAHQKASAHLIGLPTIDDWDWWSHSTCGVWVKRWRGGLQMVEDNSWGEGAGDHGLFVLEGNKAKPNGLWIPRVVAPSIN